MVSSAAVVVRKERAVEEVKQCLVFELVYIFGLGLDHNSRGKPQYLMAFLQVGRHGIVVFAAILKLVSGWAEASFDARVGRGLGQGDLLDEGQI